MQRKQRAKTKTTMRIFTARFAKDAEKSYFYYLELCTPDALDLPGVNR